MSSRLTKDLDVALRNLVDKAGIDPKRWMAMRKLDRVGLAKHPCFASAVFAADRPESHKVALRFVSDGLLAGVTPDADQIVTSLAAMRHLERKCIHTRVAHGLLAVIGNHARGFLDTKETEPGGPFKKDPLIGMMILLEDFGHLARVGVAFEEEVKIDTDALEDHDGSRVEFFFVA